MSDAKISINAGRKVALVTGSASGIGANVAFDLASNGYFIVITGRNQDTLNKVVSKCNEISPSGNQTAASFGADLLDLKQVDELIKFVESNFDRLDVLINNACWRGDQNRNILSDAGSSRAGFHDSLQAYDSFEQVMHINLTVPLYLVHRCLLPMSQKRRMLSQDEANPLVVNLSSIASRVVVPLHTYSISKACLSELSSQLAGMTHDLGVHSVTISPGPVLTDERPHHQAMKDTTLMDRVGTTQEISNLILFVIENAHLFNGQEIDVDGGYLAKQRQTVINNNIDSQ